MYVVTAEEMRKIDRYTIDQIGIPAMVLMENAGRVVAEEVESYFKERICRVAILVGKGNNGGDGVVAARYLMEAGHKITLIYVENPELFRGEAAVQAEIAGKLRIPSCMYGKEPIDWSLYNGIVDALLGTGSNGVPKGVYAQLIEEANQTGLPIFSVDIPSGLHADTGIVHTPCIQADRTITLAYTKRGLEQYPGTDFAGEVIVRSIGIPLATAQQMNVQTFRIQEPLLSHTLGLLDYRNRTSNSHKGTYGHVLVAAGSQAMSGAALLCAKAAIRSGSGLTTLAMPERVAERLLGQVPEMMLRSLEDENFGDWQKISPQDVAELANQKDAMVFGPGVSRFKEDHKWLREVWETTICPLVLDADALNMISESEDFAAWSKRPAPVILTPHPGEMARLCGLSIAEVQQNRIELARDYAKRHNVTLVLKGARTVVACPEGQVYINVNGNPGMSTGGTGDVLAGLIAGLLAQGMTELQAACLGVYLHGAAGDRAAHARAFSSSLMASDILEHL